jgi:hypothetical protein
MENSLSSYDIVWIAKDGSKHSWPCEEHRGMVIYPRNYEMCRVTIHSDSLGPIYGCSKPKNHEGPHETLQERYAKMRWL